ncbi:MAG: potassium-transporting ATPase subunit KdpA [Thermoflexibacter sp.]|jgi:K+-transporting ATPase ATPase A chain|nr:potassium-transporting ATPase subunit KdpA [Thermoflexibacter sp.]
MNTEIFGIIFMFLATVLLAIPLGKYIANVYAENKTWSDFLQPLENLFFKISGIDPKQEMTWQEHLKALLTINFLWFFWAMLLLMTQDFHGFLNPDGNPSMTPDLAFNTAISFLVNCNLQHYSGETGLSYLSQLACMTFLQFVTAGTGMAACAVVFNAMRSTSPTPNPSPVERGNTNPKGGEGFTPLSKGEGQGVRLLGNFYNCFLKSCTRILLPISIVIAILLAFNGTPMNFEGKAEITTLEGVAQQISRGPAAAMIAIKQLGTNGGGYFGVNSAHPLENPNYLTNIVECMAIFLIPIALVFALGYYLEKKKFAWVIFGVMTIGFLILLLPTVYFEMQGSPTLAKMGINQDLGSMEGKEIRLGSAASAYWAINTTVTSNGSVNAMHDSLTPISGMMTMLGMMINALYGGVGVGFLNFYIFIIIAVFISGLMVGRTPEFLGKKIEAKEMKIAIIIALLHPFLILAGTALACWVFVNNPDIGWLNNPSFHGFAEMLYEFTSASANNGSGFEGLGDNTPFWNISTGIVLILARYLPIIGPVAIAGILASKKYIPESAGTLKTDTSTFGIMVFAVIVIIAALAFFPALVLSSITEFVMTY